MVNLSITQGITAQVGRHRVKIEDTHRKGNRLWVWVRAINGEPFLRWTHGGWAHYATALIPVEYIKQVFYRGESLGKPPAALGECECLPDLPDGRINGGRGELCSSCQSRRGDDIPF